jgi:hypothetical protein
VERVERVARRRGPVVLWETRRRVERQSSCQALVPLRAGQRALPRQARQASLPLEEPEALKQQARSPEQMVQPRVRRAPLPEAVRPAVGLQGRSPPVQEARQ